MRKRKERKEGEEEGQRHEKKLEQEDLQAELVGGGVANKVTPTGPHSCSPGCFKCFKSVLWCSGRLREAQRSPLCCVHKKKQDSKAAGVPLGM